MVTIAKLACGAAGADSLAALKLDDGEIMLEHRTRFGRTKRYPIGPDDTLRVSSEIWGRQNMETELTIVSRIGSSIEVAHFECTASRGVHADEVGAFAITVADASGCGVNVLPTKERTFAAPEFDSFPPRATPTPPPAVPYRDRLGAEVFASLPTLDAIALPDGTVVVESSAYAFVWPISAASTLVVWPHEGVGCVETTLSCLEQSPELGDFEWNHKTKTGIHPDEVGAFARAIAERTGCAIHVEAVQDRLSPTPVRSKPAPAPPPRPSYVYYVDRPGVEVIANLDYLNALRLPDGTVIIERLPSGIFCTVSSTDTLLISPWEHTIGTPSVETWIIRIGVSGSLGEFEWDPVTKAGISTDDVLAFAQAVASATGCRVKNEPR